jgi:hypothetical protein
MRPTAEVRPRPIKQLKRTLRQLVGYKPRIKSKSDPLPNRVLAAEGITGWFSRRECRRLYVTAAMTAGPILEIGHFLGRSTACICEAIRDVGKPRVFRSYDLGFRSSAEFKEYYDRLHRSDVPVPVEYEQIVFSRGTTTTELALGNLRKLGLERFVELTSGDAFQLDHGKYELIFCDASHDLHEIEANLPHLVARSNRGCIWALHDMNQANIEKVIALAKVEFCELTGSLGTFVYLGGDTTAS